MDGSFANKLLWSLVADSDEILKVHIVYFYFLTPPYLSILSQVILFVNTLAFGFWRITGVGLWKIG